MNLKILKKDLTRKKSINVILLIFMILAITFIAGSVNNLLVISNAMNNYIEAAGIRDVTLLTGKKSYDEETANDKAVVEFLDNNDMVTDYVVDCYPILDEESLCFAESGESIIGINTVFLASIESRQEKIFDSSNEEIREIAPGEIYLSRNIYEDKKIKVGDVLYLKGRDGYCRELRVAGYFKDCMWGSDFMGNKRFVISEEDFRDFVENVPMYSYTVYSINCDDQNELAGEIDNQDFQTASIVLKSEMKLFYFMDMLISVVFLVISVCLIVISVIMLRMTIIFTVNEDYKEIGILKAVGIKDSVIRGLYLTKYTLISVLGTITGFALSIPFSRLMLNQSAKNILITNNGSNVLFQLLCSILSGALVVLFAYVSTGKIKKLKPMDAIRSGSNGERFKRKGLLSLNRTGMKPTTFMALNDVSSELGKYIVIFLTSVIGIWMVVMFANTINTFKSNKIGPLFGTPESDYLIVPSDEDVEDFINSDKDFFYEKIEEVEKKLAENDIETEEVSMVIGFVFKISYGDKSTRTISFQDLGSSPDSHKYEQGKAPVYDNEIAITHVISKRIGAGIGDTVTVLLGGEKKEFVVTGIFQSLNNMGEGIRFTEHAKLPYEEKLSIMGVFIRLKDNSDVKYAMDKSREIFSGLTVKTTSDFIADMMGNFMKSLDGIKYFVLTLVIGISVLVVALMQKMFLVRERSEVSMLKSIGFSNRAIISWQAKRIAFVVFAGVLAGSLTGTLFSRLTAGSIFKYMGASAIEFEIKPLEVYVIYPVILLVVTVGVCILTMLKVNKVSVQEINNAE